MSVLDALVAALSGVVGGAAAWFAARHALKAGRPEMVAIPVGVGIALARIFEATGG